MSSKFPLPGNAHWLLQDVGAKSIGGHKFSLTTVSHESIGEIEHRGTEPHNVVGAKYKTNEDDAENMSVGCDAFVSLGSSGMRRS